jgi:formylglycine-generating enzyme required for sulfatase activity
MLLAITPAVCSAADESSDVSHVRNPDSVAAAEAEMKPYTQRLRDTEIEFDMVPIPGGEFVMGSPESEEGRSEDEGPQHKVKIDPFWMGKREVSWDEYDIWRLKLDVQRRKLMSREPDAIDLKADGVTRPTKEYTDMTFGMGHDGFPATGLTQLAAKSYCVWLTERTGQYYRLPTEAEWEYACRAGAADAKPMDKKALGEIAWFYDNGDDSTHPVGKKKPNAWGLYDMMGNVLEWCKGPDGKPVAKGGSWREEAKDVTCAARFFQDSSWNSTDPQNPKSKWWLSDGNFIGFRVVREE